ncbi:MAG: TonB family protein [Candidatus Cyclobacteriaceae bacterium M2_1C_046]
MQHRQLTILTIIILSIGSTFNCNAQIDSASNSNKITILEPPIYEFPGGYDSLNKFIEKHLDWQVGQSTVQGNVYANFEIQKDGSISNIKIVKGLCPECDKAAIKLIKKMPNWIIMENADPVPQEVTIPIKFNGLK